MKGKGWILAAVFAGLMGYIVYSSLQLDQVSCEVCMDFKGQQSCRTARGATEPDAIRAALDNACARIAVGRTDSVLCTGSQPATVSCSAN